MEKRSSAYNLDRLRCILHGLLQIPRTRQAHCTSHRRWSLTLRCMWWRWRQCSDMKWPPSGASWLANDVECYSIVRSTRISEFGDGHHKGSPDVWLSDAVVDLPWLWQSVCRVRIGVLSNNAPALTALRFLDILRTYSIDINGTMWSGCSRWTVGISIIRGPKAVTKLVAPNLPITTFRHRTRYKVTVILSLVRTYVFLLLCYADVISGAFICL